MSFIKENIFKDFCNLSLQVQKIQEKIANTSVTPRARKVLHKELETVQSSIERLREGAMATQNQAASAFAQFEEMENQIISLYREIEESFENYEITLISQEALDLGNSMERGAMFKIGKKVSALKVHIDFLFQRRRPSLQNRKIVHLALKMTQHVDAALASKGKNSKEQIKLIHLLKMLLQEAVLRLGMNVDPREEELAMELYEIVDLLYRKEKNEALLKLKVIRSQLKGAQARRIDAAENDAEKLISILLEIADGDPCLDWERPERESVIHALFA